MASLRQVRRRMRSIENINEITKAMGMIAAFRFRKAEIRFSKSKAYFASMERLVANLSSAAENLSDPLFLKREAKKKLLVVITADKGLCGSYNSNLFRRADRWIAENAGVETCVAPIGKIGIDYFRRKHVNTLFNYPDKTSADLSMAKRIAQDLKNAFLSGEVDDIQILYSSYKVGAPGVLKMIPYLSLSYLLENKDSKHAPVEYIYEPDFKEVFLSLLAKYIEGKIFSILLESLTSEYSARMIAMKQATENGEEVLDDLKLLRNKTRQATITRELSEIVGGASVLA